jgi:dTDP-4-dehydrorhamnose reductase
VRWLITGGRGQLGSDLVAALRDEPVRGVGRAELDITDPPAVERPMLSSMPLHTLRSTPSQTRMLPTG